MPREAATTTSPESPPPDAPSAPPPPAPEKRLANPDGLADDHAGPFHIGMLLVEGVEIPAGYSLPVEEPALVSCGGQSPVPTTEVLAHRGGTHETLRLQLAPDGARVAVIQFEPPNDLTTAEGIGVRDTARSVARVYGTPTKVLPRASASGPSCATFTAHPGLAFCFAARSWEHALSQNAPLSAICVFGT